MKHPPKIGDLVCDDMGNLGFIINIEKSDIFQAKIEIEFFDNGRVYTYHGCSGIVKALQENFENFKQR